MWGCAVPLWGRQDPDATARGYQAGHVEELVGKREEPHLTQNGSVTVRLLSRGRATMACQGRL